MNILVNVLGTIKEIDAETEKVSLSLQNEEAAHTLMGTGKLVPTKFLSEANPDTKNHHLVR